MKWSTYLDTPFETALRLFLLSLISVSIGSIASENSNEEFNAIGNTNSLDWHSIKQNQTTTFKTTYGDVVIALHPTLAPKHVARFKNLIKAGFYNEQYFYRVVDGFVAQAGSNDNHDPAKFDKALLSNIEAEFTQPLSSNATIIESDDMFAPYTGFLDGFPVGIDKERNEMWGLHCPGTVAFARNSEKDTASTEFYIVIGQAPRHLDRNMSVIGRVVEGMDILQKLPRGDKALGGVIEQLTNESVIKQAFIHSDTVAPYYVQLPTHEEYQKRINTGKNLDNPFFHDNSYGPRPIDVCYYLTKATKKPQ